MHGKTLRENEMKQFKTGKQTTWTSKMQPEMSMSAFMCIFKHFTQSQFTLHCILFLKWPWRFKNSLTSAIETQCFNSAEAQTLIFQLSQWKGHSHIVYTVDLNYSTNLFIPQFCFVLFRTAGEFFYNYVYRQVQRFYFPF